jgi:excisionase family DNA binding protein
MLGSDGAIVNKHWTQSAFPWKLFKEGFDTQWALPLGRFSMELGKKLPAKAFTSTGPHFEPLIDTDEAAALLQIHPKTLQHMARRGDVLGYQLGKLWRFRASDLPVGLAS